MSRSRVKYPNLLLDGVIRLPRGHVLRSLEQTKHVYICVVSYAHLYDNLGAPVIEETGRPSDIQWELGTQHGVVTICVADRSEQSSRGPLSVELHKQMNWDVYAQTKEAAEVIQRYLRVEFTPHQ
jgi:hypothetical protein